jgi:hypothetical protein
MVKGTQKGGRILVFDPVHGTTNPMSSTAMAIVGALDVHDRKDQHDGTSFVAGAMKQCSCVRAFYSSPNYSGT